MGGLKAEPEPKPANLASPSVGPTIRVWIYMVKNGLLWIGME